jgi:hypothetical protein
LAEVRVKGQPGEFPLEVDLVFRPVGRVMQHGVGVVENVALGDGGELFFDNSGRVLELHRVQSQLVTEEI